MAYPTPKGARNERFGVPLVQLVARPLGPRHQPEAEAEARFGFAADEHTPMLDRPAVSDKFEESILFEETGFATPLVQTLLVVVTACLFLVILLEIPYHFLYANRTEAVTAFVISYAGGGALVALALFFTRTHELRALRDSIAADKEELCAAAAGAARLSPDAPAVAEFARTFAAQHRTPGGARVRYTLVDRSIVSIPRHVTQKESALHFGTALNNWMLGMSLGACLAVVAAFVYYIAAQDTRTHISAALAAASFAVVCMHAWKWRAHTRRAGAGERAAARN